ncbi:MAG: hypothetical protein ABSH33_21480, partial [Steroidobacteraceae bacterium]
RYDELAPILLNEIQKQQKTLVAQAEKIDAQDAKVRSLEQQVAKVNELEHELAEMHAALTTLQSKDQLLAQR